LTWHAFKKHNGKVVVASSAELKAKDISCSAWEVRRDWMMYSVADKRGDGVVCIERPSKRVLILRLVFA